MNVLAIDTATEILGIALAQGSRRTKAPADGPVSPHGVAERRRDGGLRHAQTAAGEISKLLEACDLPASQLDLIAVTSGPGSFTGLRIGMSLAKGLSAGTGTPLVGISSLDRFSYHLWWTNTTIVPVIDARKKRFYAAIYRGATRASEDLDITGSELLREIDAARRAGEAGDRNVPGAKVVLTGPHAEPFAYLFGAGRDFTIDPAARSSSLTGMIELAVRRYEAGEILREGEGPRYLRESDARLPSAGGG